MVVTEQKLRRSICSELFHFLLPSSSYCFLRSSRSPENKLSRVRRSMSHDIISTGFSCQSGSSQRQEQLGVEWEIMPTVSPSGQTKCIKTQTAKLLRKLSTLSTICTFLISFLLRVLASQHCPVHSQLHPPSPARSKDGWTLLCSSFLRHTYLPGVSTLHLLLL